MLNEEIKVLSTVGSIDFDHKELKAKVQEAMIPYAEMKVTSGTVGDAKKDRAELNKLKTAIDDKRKSIKKLYCEPLDQFETKIKEVVAIIDGAVSNIDSQIKAQEQSDKEAKKFEIELYYSSLGSPVALDKVYDPSWLNITVTTKQWTTELENAITKVKQDLATIDMIGVDDKTLLKNLYLESLNITQAKEQYDRLKQPIVSEEIIEVEFTEVKQEEQPLIFKELQIYATEKEWSKLYKFLEDNHIVFEEGMV